MAASDGAVVRRVAAAEGVAVPAGAWGEARAALVAGGAFAADGFQPGWLALLACLAVTVGLRVLAVWRDWRLPAWRT